MENPGSPPSSQKPEKKRKRQTLYRAHDTTDVHSTGAGKTAAALPGRPAKLTLFDLDTAPPKWLPPSLSRAHGAAANVTVGTAVEIERATHLNRLGKRFTQLCRTHGVEASPLLSFERWRFASKCGEDQSSGGKGQEKKGADPVIPSGRAVQTSLIADLVRAGMTDANAIVVEKELADAARQATKAVSKLKQLLLSGKAADASVKVERHKHSMDLSGGGHFVKLNTAYYSKLQRLWEQAGGEVEGKAKGEDGAGTTAFHHRLFSLLLRYKSLGGYGFQAAAGPPVFQMLHTRLGVAFECFASPLNCYFGRYCSAFPDVDAAFGSTGSFFSFKPTHGSYQANPPFVPYIMDAMASHITALLAAAEEGGHALSFTVILPGWKDSAGWQELSMSKFLRESLNVAADDHGFCDGASHQRQDPYRTSPYNTSVFFVQTSKGSRRWTVTDAVLTELASAFAACCPSETAVLRHAKGGSAAKRRKKKPKTDGAKAEGGEKPQ